MLQDPTLKAALSRVQQVIGQTARPAPAQPGFKVSPAALRTHGLDLWNAIVDPMIDPLGPLDGEPQQRTLLDGPQYAVYVLFSVDTDIDDGGLWEVYFNSSGVFAQRAVSLLREVGAPLHADVLARANHIIWSNGEIPASVEQRRRTVTLADTPRFDAVNSAWDAAERREGSLDSIIESYVRRHPSAFFD